MPAKAVRGAAQFATELAAVDEIVAALAKAEKVLGKATRAKDTVAIAMVSEEIQGLRRRGHEQLVALGGRAKLPAALDRAERMRWKRAAEAAAAPKPKRSRKPRVPTPPPVPVPVRKVDSGWSVDDASGIRTREIHASRTGNDQQDIRHCRARLRGRGRSVPHALCAR